MANRKPVKIDTTNGLVRGFESGDTIDLIYLALLNTLTEKTSLADDDQFLIGDSAASDVLKYIKKSNLGLSADDWLPWSSLTFGSFM